MANEQNLIPNSEKSPKEVREQGRRGGIESGKVRRKKKMMRDSLQAVLSMTLQEGASKDVDEIMSLAGCKGQNITVQDALMVKCIQECMKKPNPQLIAFIRDTIGEKPTDALDITASTSTKFSDILKQLGEKE